MYLPDEDSVLVGRLLDIPCTHQIKTARFPDACGAKPWGEKVPWPWRSSLIGDNAVKSPLGVSNSLCAPDMHSMRGLTCCSKVIWERV